MPEGSATARKGTSYVLFMKVAAITTIILLTLFARGFRPGMVIVFIIIPLWLLTEKVIDKTESPSLWKSAEKKEEFSRLPLNDDIKKMKGARKGQKVKQAILEGRIKDQVFHTLKNEYNLSEKEIKILDEDPDIFSEKIDNEKLMDYIKNARDLNDMKKPDGVDESDLFSDEETSRSELEELGFEEKISSAISELEKIHYVDEER